MVCLTSSTSAGSAPVRITTIILLTALTFAGKTKTQGPCGSCVCGHDCLCCRALLGGIRTR